MCGILASLNWDGGGSSERVQKGLTALRHRGPDGCRAWQSSDGRVTLGHARLKVIDFAAGDQPHTNETGTIHSVVNGEFYGYEEIRRQLAARGHQFRSQSDSEILVHLYEEHGIDCVHQLRGEFAFVLWDESAGLLLAARDRFGIKPLFFSESADGLLIASEVKALHGAGVAPAWDEQGFFEKLTLQSNLAGRTLFRDVSELPPAHFLIARNRFITQQRYWDFDYPCEASIKTNDSDDELAEKLLHSLREATHIRMRADVPVACYLSGGIDSASVLALMSLHGGKPIDSFCLAFDEEAYDESGLAQHTADFLEARLNRVPVSEELIAREMEATVWHSETLFANAQCVAKFVLSRAVRDAGFRVVMTGEGADEILGGYPAFVVDAAAPVHCSDNAHSAFVQRLGYLPAWHKVQDSFLAVMQDALPACFEPEAIRHRLLDGINISAQMEGRAVLNQSLYLYNRTVLPGHILTALGDRVEMAHSVEARLPFLDHRVVELTRQLPANTKVRGFAEKFLLRKAMRTLVPPEVCGRRKWALQSPPFLSRSGPMRELLHDTLSGSDLNALPFLEKAGVAQLLERSNLNAEGPLMTLLTACLLARQFRL